MKALLLRIFLRPLSLFASQLDFLFWRSKAKKRLINQKLIAFTNDLVLVDIGASYFSNPNWRFALANNSNKLIAIDPNASNLAYLQNSNVCEFEAHAVALSGDDKVKILYVTAEDSGSSLFKPVITKQNFHKTDFELDAYLFPYVEREIKTHKLNEILPNLDAKKSYWIKIDTQGAELEILNSSKNLFMSGLVPIVEVEGSLLFEPIMQGGSKATDLILFMEESGYELIKLTPIFSKNAPHLFEAQRGFLNESDLVFGLRPHSFESWSLTQKKSLFSGYISYGLVELGYLLASKDVELRNSLESSELWFKNKKDFLRLIESLIVRL